ncbi:MAG: hypothetical protein V4702_03405 [Patescibacteria group bacterium]
MQKVVDYMLVEQASTDRLTSAVLKARVDGWVPSGTVIAYGNQLIQAMVKFD